MTLPPAPYCDQHGQSVPLGAELGRGGQGAVFRLEGQPHAVAKIYLRPPDPQQAQKLLAQVGSFDEQLAQISTWPQQTLHDASGQLVGFVMPLVSQDEFYELHNLFAPVSRRKYFPQAGWGFLVHVARNLARAFAALHGHGHLMGDVNSRNILVSAQGLVRLIDTDSFQVRLGQQVFACPVATAECTPPELQGQHFGTLIRTPDHDLFGLALLIFQLLFEGRHPYSGIHDDGALLSPAEAIGARAFAYARQARGVRPPPGTLSLRDLPPSLAALFEQAFGSDHRPSAETWETALGQLQTELAVCSKDPSHQHYRGVSCPWCRLRPLIQRARRAEWKGNRQHLLAEVARLWQQAEALQWPAPTPVANVVAVRRVTQPLSLGLPPRVTRKPPSPVRWLLRVGVMVGLFFAVRWLTGVMPWLNGLALLAVLAWLLLSVAPENDDPYTGTRSYSGKRPAVDGWALADRVFERVLRRYRALEDLLLPGERAQRGAYALYWTTLFRRCEETEQQLQAERLALRVLRQKHEQNQPLQRFKVRYEQLAQQREQLVRRIRSGGATSPVLAEYRQQRLEAYLATQVLRTGVVAGVGGRMVAALAQKGIRTALDITPQRLQQAGAARQSELLQWRSGLERFFQFDARQIPPEILAKARREQDRQLRHDLAQFETQVQALAQASVQWQQQTQALEGQIRGTGQRIWQLEQALAELRRLSESL